MVVKRVFGPLYRPFFKLWREKCVARSVESKFNMLCSDSLGKQRIYYLGTVTHNNLGDNAQLFCIREWIKENYPDALVTEFSPVEVTTKRAQFVEHYSKCKQNNDIIVFQSGYTTQDLGGLHDEMHRLVIDNFPNAKILMMPQTIFFQRKENELRTSSSYNSAENMLFLSRDKVSYKKAVEMFPDLKLALYPDIVTTLIGKFDFLNKRKGILLCRRNDGEKFYSEEELQKLSGTLEANFGEKVTISDTTKNIPKDKLKNDLLGVLMDEFEEYSKYKVIITDRYHGTIFSLVANTPVIVIKTNDHKVSTGVQWFDGVYDIVSFADDLNMVVSSVAKILNDYKEVKLKPHFKQVYYDKLKDLFEK